MIEFRVNKWIFLKTLIKKTIEYYITTHSLAIISMCVCIIVALLTLPIYESFRNTILTLIVVPLSFYILILINIITFLCKVPNFIFECKWVYSHSNVQHLVFVCQYANLEIPFDLRKDIYISIPSMNVQRYSITEKFFKNIFLMSVSKRTINSWLHKILLLS